MTQAQGCVLIPLCNQPSRISQRRWEPPPEPRAAGVGDNGQSANGRFRTSSDTDRAQRQGGGARGPRCDDRGSRAAPDGDWGSSPPRCRQRGLQAEVLAQLEDLRASRARVVEVGDSERRRLERNLHDGAQQRLLALSYDLRLARAGSKTSGAPEVTALLTSAEKEAQTAIDELRELAHGIYPAVLTEAGIGPALWTLADSAPLPSSWVSFRTIASPGGGADGLRGGFRGHRCPPASWARRMWGSGCRDRGRRARGHSGPSAVLVGATVQLYARGVDNAIWQNALVDGQWRGWVSVGGAAASAPSAAVRYNGAVQLFARGFDNNLLPPPDRRRQHRLGLARRWRRDRGPSCIRGLQPDVHDAGSLAQRRRFAAPDAPERQLRLVGGRPRRQFHRLPRRPSAPTTARASTSTPSSGPTTARSPTAPRR